LQAQKLKSDLLEEGNKGGPRAEFKPKSF